MNSWQLRATAVAVLAAQRELLAVGCRLLVLSRQDEVTEAEEQETRALLEQVRLWMGESVREVG